MCNPKEVVKNFLDDHAKIGVEGAILKYYDPDCVWAIDDFEAMKGIERIKRYVTFLNATFQRPFAQFQIRHMTMDETKENAVLVEYSGCYYNQVTGDANDEYFLSVFEINENGKITARYDGFEYRDYRTGAAVPHGEDALFEYEKYPEDFHRHVYKEDPEKLKTQHSMEIVKKFLSLHDEKGFVGAYKEMMAPDVFWSIVAKNKLSHADGKDACVAGISAMDKIWKRPYARMDIRYIGQCEDGTVLTYWVEYCENRDDGYVTPYIGPDVYAGGVWTALEVKDDKIYRVRSYYDSSTYVTPPVIKFGLDY